MDWAETLPAPTVVVLSETRHAGTPSWANSFLANRGWSAQWSQPPPPTRHGGPSQGGTVVIWPRDSPLACGASPRSNNHRSVIRQWAGLSVTSAYGPADGASATWLTEAMFNATSHEGHAIIAGDLNWRRPYHQLLGSDWSVSEHLPSTLSGFSAPTRILLSAGLTASPHAAPTPLRGIPHHAAMSWAVSSPCALQQLCAPPRSTRMRRTALYEFSAVETDSVLYARDALECVWEDHFSEVISDPSPSPASIRQRLSAWHAAAETVCKEAVQLDYAACLRPAERAKGSPPTTRPTNAACPAGAFESVQIRRLNRLHRAASHEWNRNASGPLSKAQLRHWRAAIRDNLFTDRSVPCSQSEALSVLNRSLTAQAALEAKACTRVWKLNFAERARCVKAARPLLKPSPASTMSAALLREKLAAFSDSAPTSASMADAWTQAARSAGMTAAPPQECFVSAEAWDVALRSVSGAAGIDGWTAREIKDLTVVLPCAMEDLRHILNDLLSCAAVIDSQDFDDLFSWFLWGIPKRNTDELRGIAGASILLRTFLSCINASLPCLPDGQWGGQKDRCAVRATANWLAGPGDCGQERDLTKAFDTVEYPVAAAALSFQGVGPNTIAFLKAGWAGQRFCKVGIVAEPFRPKRGIPQGDPTAPKILGNVLAPWHFDVDARPSVKAWAYIDDRSLRYSSASHAEGQQAIAATNAFDQSVGLTENTAKRQDWQGQDAVEHLGLVCRPNAATPATLRDGWDPIWDLVARLARCPGSIPTRSAIAAAFIVPAYSWAAALTEAPPAKMAPSLMRSIVGSNNWWCVGRFFADRIHLHPCLGDAVAAFRQLPRIASASSGVRDAAISAHARALSLQVVSLDADEGATLAPLPGADPRIAAAAGASFTACTDKGLHTLRVIARICALMQIHKNRHDFEGALEVDVEASCSPKWHKWVASLSPSDATLVSVYRGGAVWTPTRRYRDARSLTCPLCHEKVRPSARHLWATCAALSVQRARIGADHRLLPSWWHKQPRCTAKTAWITTTAAATCRQRTEYAIAAGKMGIVVCRAMAPYIGQEPVAPLLLATTPAPTPAPSAMAPPPTTAPSPAPVPLPSALHGYPSTYASPQACPLPPLFASPQACPLPPL